MATGTVKIPHLSNRHGLVSRIIILSTLHRALTSICPGDAHDAQICVQFELFSLGRSGAGELASHHLPYWVCYSDYYPLS